MPILLSAREQALKKPVVPAGNQAEARFITDMEIYAPETLGQLAGFFDGALKLEPVANEAWDALKRTPAGGGGFQPR